MKKLLSLLIAMAMILSLCACGSSGTAAKSETAATDEVLNVTFNIAVSGGTYDGLSEVFQKRCDELSDGKIKVQIVAPTTLGSARETVEACQLNTVNMIWSADSELDQVVGNLSWAWIPYTVISYEDADKYYNEGWIDEAIGTLCENAGIKCVAGAENGFRLFAATGSAPQSLADIKGMKIRIPEQKPLVRFYELIGCLPSTITASESFAAMQQGTVDGSDNTLFNLHNLGFFDIVDYIEVINYQYSSAKICANLEWYNGLTEEQRKVIDQAAYEAGMYQRETLRSQESELIEEAKGKGIDVAYPSEAFQDEIRGCAMTMWEEAYTDYDAAVHPYIDKLIETFK